MAYPLRCLLDQLIDCSAPPDSPASEALALVRTIGLQGMRATAT